MYQISLNKSEHVHFIGIGGISMSGLIEILLEEGLTVTGSGSHKTELIDRLTDRGARVYYGQRAANTEKKPGVDVVAYTATIHKDNPEFTAIRGKGIPMLSRAELLGGMMRNYRQAVTVSGTHGRTTTTPMATDILSAGDMDPIISVGGILQDIGDNTRVGGSELFVTEACEYASNFLPFSPTMEVILSIEEDHPDFFEDIQDIRHSSWSSAERLLATGLLVVNSGIGAVDEIIRGLEYQVVTFEKDAASTYTTQNISYDKYARSSYGPVAQGEVVNHITLGVTGKRNAYNSLTAIAAAMELGVGFDAVMSGPKKFTGTDRRSKKKGKVDGATIIDDYAHHPREIRATLSAARGYPHKRLWCVFQPYTYTRVETFLDQFADTLPSADVVIPADIYAARETDTLGVNSRDIADRVKKLDTEVRYTPSFDEVEAFILENCMNDNLLIAIGTGDIVKVGGKLLGQ